MSVYTSQTRHLYGGLPYSQHASCKDTSDMGNSYKNQCV